MKEDRGIVRALAGLKESVEALGEKSTTIPGKNLDKAQDYLVDLGNEVMEILDGYGAEQKTKNEVADKFNKLLGMVREIYYSFYRK